MLIYVCQEDNNLNIIRTKNFDKSYKYIKKYNKEYTNLNKIIDIIENTSSFKVLCNLPQVRMYGFERLKHDKKDFYSFNLSKSGGIIRLIVKPLSDDSIELFLILISYNHYEDFDPKKVIYYE